GGPVLVAVLGEQVAACARERGLVRGRAAVGARGGDRGLESDGVDGDVAVQAQNVVAQREDRRAVRARCIQRAARRVDGLMQVVGNGTRVVAVRPQQGGGLVA